MMLGSHHNVPKKQRRPFRLGQLNRLQVSAGWQIFHPSYLNAFLFPAVALVRLFQRGSESPSTSSYDMGPDLGPFNKVLEWLLRLEAWLITQLHIRLPFGVDLLSVSRKKVDQD